MKRLLTLSLFFCLLASSQITTYQTVKAPAPKLDGVLNDACWKKACVVDHFSLLGKGKTKEAAELPATRALLAFDDQALYIAMDCDEPLAKEISCSATEHDGRTWADDGVEIFLNPAGDRNSFVQLAVNAKGIVMDGLKETPENRLDLAWDSGATVATKIAADSWTLEMRIPFATLPLDGPEKDWTFHIARNRRVAGQHLTSLQTPINGFHEIAKFDVLRGIRPVGFDISVKNLELGSFLRGRNHSSVLLKNWNKTTPQIVTLIFGFKNQEQTQKLSLAPRAEQLWIGSWNLGPEDAKKEFSLRVQANQQTIRSAKKVLETVPPVFPGLPKQVFYQTMHKAVRLEMPLQIADLESSGGTLTWSAKNAKGEMVGEGRTLARTNPAVIRLYWLKWFPGKYTLQFQLSLPGETPISSETTLRLLSTPWDD